MDPGEKKLCEEVRKCMNLYDASSPNYKDIQMAAKSWRSISVAVGLEMIECQRRWKVLRDRFVRMKRKGGKSGKAANGTADFYNLMSWLSPHIRHRESELKLTFVKISKHNSDLPVVLSEVNTLLSERADAPQPPTSSPDMLAPPSSLQSSNPQPNGPHLSNAQPSITGQQSHPDSVQPAPHMTFKRKRSKVKSSQLDDDNLLREIEARRKASEERMLTLMDECNRFGAHVGDLLRRVPESQRAIAMRDVTSILYNFIV
ncbi:uncharacterized protein LOC144023810 [Festucalex cinctus]